MKTYLKGSYEDYLGLDENYLKSNKKNLRNIILKLAPTANRRLDRLKKNNMSTPAYRAVMEGKSGAGVLKKGRFGGVEGKSTSQLVAEYKRISNFLDDKTSTVSGYQDFLDEQARKLGFDNYYENKKEIDRLWEIYNRSKGKKPIFEGGGEAYGSDQRIRKIKDLMDKGFTDEEIFNKITDNLEKMMVEKERAEEEEERQNAEQALFIEERSNRDRIREARDRARRGG